MGYFSSTQTTKNETGPLSAEGMSWDSLTTNGIIAYLQDYGNYDIKPTEVTKYRVEYQSKADTYHGQIDKYEQQIDKLKSDRQIVLLNKRAV